MDSDFLTSLRTFDKDHIPAATVQKIRPFIANPEFEPNKVLTVRLVQQAVICSLLLLRALTGAALPAQVYVCTMEWCCTAGVLADYCCLCKSSCRPVTTANNLTAGGMAGQQGSLRSMLLGARNGGI